MDGRREFVIRVNPRNCTIFLEQETRGVKSCKEIDATDLYTYIAKNTLDKDMLCSGVLPGGCVSITQHQSGKKYVVLEYLERRTGILYYSLDYKDFPLPRLLFGFTVEADGKVTQARLGVVKDGPLTGETAMHHYPFSNVYSDSVICMGDNALPTISSLGELSKLAGDILKLPNNEDLFRVGDNRLEMSYPQLLEHLKDKDPAYYDARVLVPDGKTLSDFIQVPVKEDD